MNGMPKSTRHGDSASPAGRYLKVLFAGAACALLTSCTSWFAPAQYDDYVGPLSPEAPKRTSIPGIPVPAKPQETPKLPEAGPVEVSVPDAILVALQNNEAFQVQRYNPSILATLVDQARAAFDPLLDATISRMRQTTRFATGGAPGSVSTSSAGVSVTEFLPTGTTVVLSGTGSQTHLPTNVSQGSAGANLSVTQSLLRGFGTAVNLATLRQAKINVEISQYELRGFAEALVAQVEEAYWAYLLAQKEMAIFTQSAKLAADQLDETKEMVRVGKLAQTELYSAEAELASRQEDLINGRSALDTARLNLLRLINPRGEESWGREIVPKDQPAVTEGELEDVASHVAVGLRMRPDLNEARLQVQHGELDVVRTKNGLLPRLDAFVNFGRSGFSDTFTNSVNNMGKTSFNAGAGLNFEYPIGNRGPEAAYRSAKFSLEQARTAVDNLAQLVQVDVRTAYINVVRAKEQVAATAATRKLQEQKTQAEIEKLRIGRSTTLLVAQAERDLLQSQINEVQAVINHMTSLVELYRLEGSLLERRGIAAPGREPVDISTERRW
jgi:outer membrane protein TolC